MKENHTPYKYSYALKCHMQSLLNIDSSYFSFFQALIIVFIVTFIVICESSLVSDILSLHIFFCIFTTQIIKFYDLKLTTLRRET